MWVNEREFSVAAPPDGDDHFDHIIKVLDSILADDELPLRFVVTQSTSAGMKGEALILHSADSSPDRSLIEPLRLVRFRS